MPDRVDKVRLLFEGRVRLDEAVIGRATVSPEIIPMMHKRQSIASNSVR